MSRSTIAVALAVVLFASGPSVMANQCTDLVAQIAGFKNERADLQEQLGTVPTSQKPPIVTAINKLTTQINNAELLLDQISYKFPFAHATSFKLCQGNWDDPTNGHGSQATDGQAFAFDFSSTISGDCGNTTEGADVKAMRGGTVIALAFDRTCNTFQKPPGDPCFGAPGEGNFVLIRHSDNTVASYGHMQVNSIKVWFPQKVVRGQVLGKIGNTGWSSDAHVHVDVRTYWNSATDLGPTMPIVFQDQNHKPGTCWRPRVTDTLKSNN